MEKNNTLVVAAIILTAGMIITALILTSGRRDPGAAAANAQAGIGTAGVGGSRTDLSLPAGKGGVGAKPAPGKGMAGQNENEKVPEAQARTLVGVWTTSRKLPLDVENSGTLEFREDGTFSEIGRSNTKWGEIVRTGSGRYTYENCVLTLSYTDGDSNGASGSA